MTKYMPIIRNGEIIAIAFIGFDINRDLMDLIDTINSKVVGDTGYYYVLNSDEKSSKYGHFIAHPTLQHTSALELTADGIYFIKDILKTKNGKILYMWEGHKKLVIYQNFEEWNWLLVAEASYDEFFEDANQVMYLMIILSAVVAVSISLVLYLIVRVSLKDLETIKDGLISFFDY